MAERRRVKVVTPATLFVGPLLLLLGFLALSSGGPAGPLILLVGTVVTVAGAVIRERRVRTEVDFQVAMLLHEADDDDPVEETRTSS